MFLEGKIQHLINIPAPNLLKLTSRKRDIHERKYVKWGTMTRGGVEDTRLEAKAKAKDTKISEAKAKDSLSEDRTSRGQGQECSRPRTKDTRASVLQKKKVIKIFFQAISNSLAYPEFLIGGGLNHKSHEMTTSKFFQRERTCGTKLS